MTEGGKFELSPWEAHSLPKETRCVHKGVFMPGSGVLWEFKGVGVAWPRGSGLGLQIEWLGHCLLLKVFFFNFLFGNDFKLSEELQK